MRQKERRLHSMLRHEQQTVRTALATAFQVGKRRWSCSRTPPCGDRRLAPEPGRVRCTRRTTLHGDRTHLGARQGILAEPGPQRSDRSRRHPKASRPSAFPYWLWSSGEAIDSFALSLLTAQALEAKRKEEQEEVSKELDVLIISQLCDLTSLDRRRLVDLRRAGASHEKWKK